MTRVSTFAPSTAATTSSTRPSLMRMRWPSCTSRGSGVNGVETIDALPISGSVVIVSICPFFSWMTPSTSPMRSFGPWMSPRIGMYLPWSVETRRMISMSRTRSAGVPCEKFIRKTSTPEVSRRRMRSSDAHAGPSVAMIFVRAHAVACQRGCSDRPTTCAIASHSRTICAKASGRIACGPSESASSGL